MPRNKKLLFNILKETLSIPTAPFKEQWLIAKIISRFKGRKNFGIKRDKAGNLLVEYKPASAKKIHLTFHAHLDHPGFIFKEMMGKKRGRAEALGGVPQVCKGGKVRFFSSANDTGVAGRVLKYKKRGHNQEIEIALSKPVPKGSVGMWDFPAFKVRGKWLEGRAFDDNLGSAILIYLLEYLERTKSRAQISVLFTRAEEVGYVGAVELLTKKSLKLSPTIITLEMPRAGMGLVPGDGVMLRAGDRYLNFDPTLLLYFEKLAGDLKKRSKTFKSQRRLGLFGGTEITSFDLFGYRSGALCSAVDNGHNINHGAGGKPAPERVHLNDLLSMTDLLEKIVATPFDPKALKADLRKRVSTYHTRLRRRLY